MTHARGWRAGGLARVDISAADIGRRVTVRHELTSGQLTDVVGNLDSWTSDGPRPASLSVTNRRGMQTSIESSRLVAARVVPPEVSAAALQRLSEAGWPPAESESLGDWMLRATYGVTGRANSARLTGDPGVPIGEALARVEGWYAERELTPQLQIPMPSGIESTLVAAGWASHRRTRFEIAETAAVIALTEDSDAAAAIERIPEPTDEWMGVLADEAPATWPVLKSILTGPSDSVFVSARDASTNKLLGTGRASASPSQVGGSRWAGITNVETVPAAKRRGVATRIVAELASWAETRGCERMYLQVLDPNEAAAALYARLGFSFHHAYEYWSRNVS